MTVPKAVCDVGAAASQAEHGHPIRHGWTVAEPDPDPIRRQVSGQGGLVDFMRGARASVGGRSVLALPATAAGGSVSRIVRGFAPGTPVTVGRGDVDMVVTEYGVADLRDAAVDERAARLVAIAAPAFRDDLTRGLR